MDHGPPASSVAVTELHLLGLAAWALCGHEAPAGCNASEDMPAGCHLGPAGGTAATGADASGSCQQTLLSVRGY